MSLEHQETKVDQDHLEEKDLMDQMDHLDMLVTQEHLGMLETLVLKDLKDNREHLVPLALVVLLEQKGEKVQMELTGRMVQLVRTVRMD